MKTNYVKCLLSFLFTLSVIIGFSQDIIMPLYPEGQIPNFKKSDVKELVEITDGIRVKKVSIPDLAVFLPSQKYSTAEAVIICPGGGYRLLSYSLEGIDIAKYWNSKGVAAFVLKYRLPDEKSQIKPYKAPLMDAQRAMRLVRFHAKKWGIDPNRIGIMGFSAGGHLAASLSTHFDGGNIQDIDSVEQVSCRPDFSILVYPVISFNEKITHLGSRNNLLGENPSQEMVDYYSNELQVTKETPPAILIHADDDESVLSKNSIEYYYALREKNISAALMIYPTGGHGFGMALNKPFLSTWLEQCYMWLKTIKTDN